MTEEEARRASTSLDALYQLADAAPGFRFQWRTRRTGTGWEADVQSGYLQGPTPRWVAVNASEIAAIDRAAGGAFDYWTATTPALKRAAQQIKP